MVLHDPHLQGVELIFWRLGFITVEDARKAPAVGRLDGVENAEGDEKDIGEEMGDIVEEPLFQLDIADGEAADCE